MRFLGWLEEPEVATHSHTREVADFAARMSSERGWSDATIEGRCQTVDRFFIWLDEKGVDLASVEISLIDQVIAGYYARGYSRSTIHLYAQQLRAKEVVRGTAGERSSRLCGQDRQRTRDPRDLDRASSRRIRVLAALALG